MISARGDRDWDAIKKDVGEYVWAALYQQRPAPAAGGIFKNTWWREYTEPRWVSRLDGTCVIPGADELVCSWDMAFKDEADSDYVCGQVWARFGLQVYLVDQVHDRMDFVTTRQAVRQLSAKWPQAIAKYVEDKANGTAVINSLSLTVSGLIPIEPDGNKISRARAVSPFVEAGQVYLPSPELCPWVGGFIDEHSMFPNAVHDDRVDAMSQALNRLLLNPILNGQIVDATDFEEFVEHQISPY
jgi:predicted phage terminase large subunit-like protein